MILLCRTKKTKITIRRVKIKIAEFFAEVGFDINSSPLGEFFGALQGTAGRVLIFAAAVRAAAFGVEKFSQKSIDAATALKSFRIETGLSAEELQKWQAAIQLTDISATADDVAGSVQSLQENLTAIRLGRGDVSPFLLAGVNPYQDAFSVIEDLRVALRGVDESLASTILQDTGLGKEFLHTIKMSNDELEALQNQYVLRNEQLEALSKAGTAFTNLGLYIQHAIDDLNAFLSPAYIAGAHALKGVVQLISSAFEFTAFAVREFTEGLEKSNPAIQQIFQYLKWTALAVAGLVALTNPWGAAVAVVLATAIAIDDIWAAIQGKVSFIGELLKKMADFVVDIKEGLSGIDWPDFLGNFIPDLNLVGQVSDLGQQLSGSMANTFNNVFNITSDNPDAVAAAVSGGMQKQLNFAYSDVNLSGQ